jgi:hypothetical protein
MDDIRSKVRSGGRLAREDGLELLRQADLLELGALAQEVRFRHNPERVVTFVIDTNLNYSNVCNATAPSAPSIDPSATPRPIPTRRRRWSRRSVAPRPRG